MTGIMAVLTGSGSSFSASMPNSVSNSVNASTVTGGPAAIVVVGGSGTYTYNTVKSFGDAITATSAATNSPSFQATLMTSGETRNADFQCTVTDSITGLSTVTNVCSVQLSRP